MNDLFATASGRSLALPAMDVLSGQRDMGRALRLLDQGVGPAARCREFLDRWPLHPDLRKQDLAAVPSQGPAILVVNRPFGGMEALVVVGAVAQKRTDVRVVAATAWMPPAGLEALFLGHGSTRGRTLLAAARHLRAGGLLVVFPGPMGLALGDSGKNRSMQWHPVVEDLLTRVRAPLIPIRVIGQGLQRPAVEGIVHPGLQGALWPRALLRHRGGSCAVRVGTPLGRTHGGVAEEWRWQQMLLRRDGRKRAERRGERLRPISRPVPAARLKSEVRSLPAGAQLAVHGSLSVLEFRAHQAPDLLQEIGRLREVTFRRAGEGSGRAVDLDRFDHHYTHLVIWDHANDVPVGAYRLAATDDGGPSAHRRPLYSETIFRFSPNFWRNLGPALELGRSFVRREYQRSYAPLGILWRGIGAYVAANPEYRYLFGPVTISGRYDPVSQALMVRYLSTADRLSPLAQWVDPPRPLVPGKTVGSVARLADGVTDVDELSRLVAAGEPDGVGVPVMLRQYLRLGARSLAFSIDPAFGYCLDALCVVDLYDTGQRTLRRYMGGDAARAYMLKRQRETA